MREGLGGACEKSTPPLLLFSLTSSKNVRKRLVTNKSSFRDCMPSAGKSYEMND